jgi:hypothetical protein
MLALFMGSLEESLKLEALLCILQLSTTAHCKTMLSLNPQLLP